MTILHGADSAVPQPTLYSGFEVYGVYAAGDTPHVWTKAEIAEAGHGGVKAVLPIVVPHGDVRWWMIDEAGGYDYLETLVRSAMAAFVPTGSPLVLDIEEGLAEMIGSHGLIVERAWVAACAAHGLLPWTYGGSTWHDSFKGGASNRWLARWPEPSGSAPAVTPGMPAGFQGLQYAGNVEGGRIDLDIFDGAHVYLGTDLKPATIGGTPAKPAGHLSAAVTALHHIAASIKESVMSDVTTTTTTPAAGNLAANHELAAVLSAIDAQVTSVRASVTDGNLAAAQNTAALLGNHAAELSTLLGVGSTAVTPAVPVTTPVTTVPVTTVPPITTTPVTTVPTGSTTDATAAAAVQTALSQIGSITSELTTLLASLEAPQQ